MPIPVWVQWVIAAGVFIPAVGLIFKKVLYPAYRAIGIVEDSLPVFQEAVATFKNNTGALKVLDTIAGEFRTDNGSSLRDSINGLTACAIELQASIAELAKVAEANRVAAETSAKVAQVAVEDNRRTSHDLAVRLEAQLLNDDKRDKQLERMLVEAARVSERVDQLLASGVRIEAAREQVATDLEERQRSEDERATGIAGDLKASRQLADHVAVDETPGSAADAASKTPPADQ